MTTSSSDNFSINRNEIIELSFEMAGIKGIGRVLSAEDIDRGQKLLNLIVKQWMGKSDFAPGLKVWARKRGYIFPALNDSEYSLGPSGDHATSSFSQTTVSSNEAIGQTVISITSTSGMANGDYIGIRCNDGSIHWSTVSSFVANTTVTIADVLTVAADAGKAIYYYTTKLRMPLEILSLRRRDTSSNETPLTPLLLNGYEDGVLNKAQSGIPGQYLYERGITDGTLRFDFKISDTSDIYLVTFLRPIDDFDSATDTPDYPQEYFRPLVGQLAMDAAMSQGLPVTAEMKLYRDEGLAMAQNVDPENVEVCFEPER